MPLVQIHWYPFYQKFDTYPILPVYIYISIDQRKFGSNTSVLRTNRIVRLDIDEGWCATWHHIDNTSQKNWHWWMVMCDLTSLNNTSQRTDIDEGWCETWHHITIHHTRIDINEGRCETKGSGDEGRWWQRECADFGKCDQGKWRLWEVVTL